MPTRKQLVPVRSSALLSIGIVVGVLILGLLVYVVQRNTGMQSQAASWGKTIQRWDFTKQTEGWSSSTLKSVMTSEGLLYSTIGAKTGALSYTTPNIKLPKGVKTFEFRLAAHTPESKRNVLGAECTISSDGTEECSGSTMDSAPGSSEGSAGWVQVVEPNVGYVTVTPGSSTRRVCRPQPTCPVGKPCQMMPIYTEGEWCDETSPEPRPKPTCMTRPPCPTGRPCPMLLMYPEGGWCDEQKPGTRTFGIKVRYWQKGEDITKTPKAKVLSVKGNMDGAMKTYSVTLPEIAAMEITRMQIAFDQGFSENDQVRVDFMRFALSAKSYPAPSK